MKMIFTFSNIIFLAAVTYLASNIIPAMVNNHSQEGQTLKVQEYMVINPADNNGKISFPSKKRNIAVFWATWCAPCKLEMARLSESVKKGKIPTGAIIAINPFEDRETIKSFLKATPYPFTFIEDSGLSRKLNITRTPTTLFLENQKIESLSSGLSFIGIWRAEQFL